MKKKTPEKDIQKIIKKFRNIKFSDNEDLYKKGIVDSFDVLNIMESLEKKFSVKLNFAKDNKFIFSVKYLSKKITFLKEK